MEKVIFNTGWKVWKDLEPFKLVFRVPDDALEIDLPYDAMFHEEQKQGAGNGGFTGNIDAGEYKYYKRFFVPEEYRGGHVMLQFEGIYRDVWLIHGGNICVRPYDLRFTTIDVDADGALVCVSAQIHNDSLDAKTLTVSVTVKDADRNIAAANSYPVRINSRSVLNFRKNIYMEQAKLWDEYEPNLYTMTLTIADGECVLDTTTISSGIRRLFLMHVINWASM